MKRRGVLPITENWQTYTFTRRAMVVGGIQAAFAALLGGRLAYLSIAENERYKLLSESNRFQLMLVPPRRGWIVDRYGQPIAINRSDYRVDLIPDQLKDPERIIAELGELLALAPDELERIREDLGRAAGYQPVPVAENLPFEKYAAVSLRLPELPGVAPMRGFSRFYPDGAAVGHLVGYVGTANKKEYEADKNPLLITPGFKIGKDGLEQTMEKRLRGEPGAKRLEVTARGKLVRELSTIPDKSGGSLPLTIDAGLQSYAARRIGVESASVVVLDCTSGDILAMASMPSYDPNSFSDGISHNEWRMLSQNDHLPLLNKTLQGLYPPGSTVKPMMALALLDAGVSPDQRVHCNGAYQVGGGRWHCWKRGGHGSVNMNDAVAQSCDVYFYHMGRQIGIDAIANTARKLGMGEEFDLPVPSQRYGTMPDSAWKKRKYKQNWTVADTINATIGQGYTLSNPLQLGVMAARIASGRALMPRLLLEKNAKPAPLLDIPPEHLAFARMTMNNVVNGGGTAGNARLPFPDIKLAGKTGTAQVRRITMAERRSGVLSNASLQWRLRDHGLFIFFAPVDQPRYAGAVVVEHGGGSGAAYPIARDTLTYLFDKDKAMAALLPLEEKWGGTIAQRMERDAKVWLAAKEAKERAAASGSAETDPQGRAT